MRKLLVCLLLIGLAGLPGPVLLAAHTDHGCKNCHVPHKAADPTDANASWGVPLWSTAQTADGLPTFDLYSSQSFDLLDTDIGQPDGATKLCLGCHDGTYSVFVNFRPNSTAIFGVGDLARSHPVSFTYSSALAANVRTSLKDPAVASSGLGGTIATDLLDSQGKMQCTSCHDVHTTGHGDYLLRFQSYNQVMCRTCHEK